MTLLDVRYDGEVVAVLDDVAGGGLASLTYTDAAVTLYGAGAVLLSVRLPVRHEAYPGVATRYWLEGLLPEDSVRAQLAIRAGVDVEDLVGLLRHYGRECAGAVSIVEQPAADTTSDPTASDAGTRWLTEPELDAAVRNLPRAPLGVDIDHRVRVSLGGLQGKLVVVVDGNRIGIPLGTHASTHILKPAPLGSDGGEQFPGIVTAEAFSLLVCRGLGLAVPQLRILSVGDRPALLIERYDRRLDDHGRTRRVHQEDLCQALGISSVAKYQQSREIPSLRHVSAILQEHATAPIPELIGMVTRVAASLVLGNCDHHAKNWSLLFDDGGLTLTPAYDVVPTALWSGHSTELGLRVGPAALLEQVNREALLAEAESWRLGRRAAVREIARVEDMLPQAVAEAAQATLTLGGDEDVVSQAITLAKRLSSQVLH